MILLAGLLRRYWIVSRPGIGSVSISGSRILIHAFVASLFQLFPVNPISLAARSVMLESPEKRLQVLIEVGDSVRYSVRIDGDRVIAPSEIGLEIDGPEQGSGPFDIAAIKHCEIDEQIVVAVPRKRNEIQDHYKEVDIEFTSGLGLCFRAYDEAVAYRWETNMPGQITVVSEKVTFTFEDDVPLWFPREDSIITPQEPLYERLSIGNISSGDLASTGLLAGLPKGRKAFISEADLRDYPGMFLRGGDGSRHCLVGKFARVVNEDALGNPQKSKRRREPFLAMTSGTRTFPWRVILITDEDRQLLESEIIYKLASPCQLEDTSWIKPGRVAWEWWHAMNLTGVDFKTGLNTTTYKHYIDFAAEYGIENILLDAGWSEEEDLLSVSPEIDMQEILRYARERNVGVILWAAWRELNQQLIPALDQFQEWGVQGIKVDYMNRDDQWMVGFYERVARETAQRRLLVDFHGSYKPTGLRRAFPNVITREGVRGLEYSKGSDSITPVHNVTLPFIRLVCGPMDYTPGAMRNGNGRNFAPMPYRPMSQGTRCHQLAMFVIYESPLQMLCDSPSNYRREPECMEFLAAVPTVWDETHALAGKVSDHVAVARRNGEDWFVGAMSGNEARDLEIQLAFLPGGQYLLKAWQDGVNADRHAEDFRVFETQVTSKSTLPVRLAPGGGWVALIKPI